MPFHNTNRRDRDYEITHKLLPCRRFVIAPQEFKGSLSAIEIARAIEVGVLRAIPHAETVLAPVADGGDGTLQSLVDSSGGRIESAAVTGPLGEMLVAEWGALGDGETAVIEMARSSGLALLDLDDRDPRMATTKGVGELIAAALDTGHTRFIIGIGGSADERRRRRHDAGARRLTGGRRGPRT